MAGNNLLHMLRGSSTSAAQILNPGQPFYNYVKNYLTVGGKDGTTGTNGKPIAARDLVGYVGDTTNNISNTNTTELYRLGNLIDDEFNVTYKGNEVLRVLDTMTMLQAPTGGLGLKTSGTNAMLFENDTDAFMRLTTEPVPGNSGESHTRVRLGNNNTVVLQHGASTNGYYGSILFEENNMYFNMLGFDSTADAYRDLEFVVAQAGSMRYAYGLLDISLAARPEGGRDIDRLFGAQIKARSIVPYTQSGRDDGEVFNLGTSTNMWDNVYTNEISATSVLTNTLRAPNSTADLDLYSNTNIQLTTPSVLINAEALRPQGDSDITVPVSLGTSVNHFTQAYIDHINTGVLTLFGDRNVSIIQQSSNGSKSISLDTRTFKYASTRGKSGYNTVWVNYNYDILYDNAIIFEDVGNVKLTNRQQAGVDTMLYTFLATLDNNGEDLISALSRFSNMSQVASSISLLVTAKDGKEYLLNTNTPISDYFRQITVDNVYNIFTISSAVLAQDIIQYITSDLNISTLFESDANYKFSLVFMGTETTDSWTNRVAIPDNFLTDSKYKAHISGTIR